MEVKIGTDTALLTYLELMEVVVAPVGPMTPSLNSSDGVKAFSYSTATTGAEDLFPSVKDAVNAFEVSLSPFADVAMVISVARVT